MGRRHGSRTLPDPNWNPAYYHRADKGGIGFDRTRTGSDAISQYAPELAAKLADPATTPESELLWFHHLPWDYRMTDGAHALGGAGGPL